MRRLGAGGGNPAQLLSTIMKQPNPQLYRIRDDKVNIWNDWCRQLMTIHRTKATSIIADEGLLAEFFIQFKINETHYVIGVMLTSTLTKLASVDPSDALNIQHKNILKECLIKASPAEYAYLIKVNPAIHPPKQ